MARLPFVAETLTENRDSRRAPLPAHANSLAILMDIGRLSAPPTGRPVSQDISARLNRAAQLLTWESARLSWKFQVGTIDKLESVYMLFSQIAEGPMRHAWKVTV